MAGCKLTKSLNDKLCEYAVAGASDLYLANYYPPVIATGAEAPTAQANTIVYKLDDDGYVSTVVLPTGEKWFRVNGSDGTISFTDALLAGGNGGKYRQHTINAVLNQNDVDVLDEGDALSLGRFVGAVVDKGGVARLLGRTGGLSAPAGGFDYNSGAAEADATGWTIIQQGTSTEIAPILKSVAVLTPLFEDPVVTP